MLQAQVDILCAMKQPRIFFKTRRLAIIAVVGSLTLFARHFYLYGQDKSEFPDGYDVVQAAPNSHKVVFENAFVRVLEVTVPATGKTEPMHHHRWPSFFLDWDRGGGSPMFDIIDRTAPFVTVRARRCQFIPALGPFSG